MKLGKTKLIMAVIISAIMIISSLAITAAAAPDASYLLSYDTHGGITTLPSKTVIPNAYTNISSVKPTLPGSIFLGWSKEYPPTGIIYQPGDWLYVDRDTTLHAIWNTTVWQATHIVKFNYTERSDWQVSWEPEVPYGSSVAETLGDYDGYLYTDGSGIIWMARWYCDADRTVLYDFNAKVTEDIIIYALWQRLSPLTLTYDANGGIGVPPSKLVIANAYTNISTMIPVRPGYIFLGWNIYPDPDPPRYKPGDWIYVDRDITLRAVWSDDPWDLPTVSFNYTEMSDWAVMWTPLISYGGNIKDEYQDFNPPNWEYTSSGVTYYAFWYTDPGRSDLFDFSTPLTKSLTLYARWVEKEDVFIVTFLDWDGALLATVAVESGFAATAPPDPFREDYVFIGWDKDFSNVTEDMTVNAQYRSDKNRVYFNYTEATGWNNSIGRIIDVPYGDNIISFYGADFNRYQEWTYDENPDDPEEPTWAAFWYTDSAHIGEGETSPYYYRFDTPVTNTITIYADWWQVIHKVTFDANGGKMANGEDSAEKRANHQKRLADSEKPVDPKRAGFEFLGWYTEPIGGEEWDFNTKIMSPITLYAQWEAGGYLVIYNSNGGNDDAPVDSENPYDMGDTVIVLSDSPTRAGYIFLGWAYDKDDDTPDFTVAGAVVTPPTFPMPADDVILYAVWEVNEEDTKDLRYTVEYYKDGVCVETATVEETVWAGDPGILTVLPVDTDRYPGYEFFGTDPEVLPLTIADGSVIKVYYLKGVFAYTVEYYYEGIIDSALTYTGSAPFESIVNTYPAQLKTGYEFVIDTAPLTITEIAADNVIMVYYVKSSFAYTVEYYYEGTIDSALTYSNLAVFGSIVSTYPAQLKTGYKFDSDDAPLTITEIAADNVIKVYYVKDSFAYTVEYYYNGVIDSDLTYSSMAVFGSTVSTYPEQLKTGYEFDGDTTPLTITEIAADNVIKVYYVKDYFAYSVEYYYEGTIDSALTYTSSALFDSIISTYPPQLKTGYKLDSDTAPLTITEIAADNVIKVYYVKDSFAYTVEYYYEGTIDSDLTYSNSAVFDSIISTYPPQLKTGYKFDSDDAPLTITEIAADNVIKVYYVKDSFAYTVEYYYEGTIDNDLTYSNSALFDSIISTYPSQLKTGYKFESDTAPLTITEISADNVIKVYYVKDSFAYTVEYYYEGIIDNDLTFTSTAVYGSIVSIYPPQLKTGYKFDSDTVPLTITEVAADNVIKVYYIEEDNEHITIVGFAFSNGTPTYTGNGSNRRGSVDVTFTFTLSDGRVVVRNETVDDIGNLGVTREFRYEFDNLECCYDAIVTVIIETDGGGWGSFLITNVSADFDPIGHFDEEWIADATCEDDGRVKHTCLICGYHYMEIIPAIGHSYDEGKLTKSTEEDGFGEWTCTCRNDDSHKLVFPLFRIIYQPGDQGTFAEETHHNLFYGADTPFAPIVTGELGYTFAGWTPEREAIVTNTVTYVAQWEIIGYKITYLNLNGASNDDNPEDFDAEDLPITLQDPGDRTGYTFKGWTLSNAGGAAVTEITEVGDHTLWANWEINTYNITYLNTFDATNSNPATFNIGDLNITLTDPVRNGYEFLGWTLTDADGVAMTEITEAGDYVLWANWEIITYYITYLNLFDAVNNNPATFDVDDLDITLLALDRTGYAFKGWTLTDSGGAAVTEITETGSYTLWANWEIITYSITYLNVFDATNSNPATFDIDELEITLEDPVRTGYAFKGWTLNDADGIAMAEITETGNLTLWANWEANTYRIIYDANTDDFEGMMTDSEPVFGEDFMLSANAYTREEYRFLGWNTKADGSGVDYMDKQEFIPWNMDLDDTLILYAIWGDKHITVEAAYSYRTRDNGGNGSDRRILLDVNFTFTMSDGRVVTDDKTIVVDVYGATETYTYLYTDLGSCYDVFAAVTIEVDGTGWGNYSISNVSVNFDIQGDYEEGAIIEDPTCEEPGLIALNCLRCGCHDVEREVLDPLGHDWKEWVNTTPTSPTVPVGERTRECNRCDKIESQPLYRVVYEPGLHGSFAAEEIVIHENQIEGDPTPAAPTPIGESGWTFNSWSPTWYTPVTRTEIYTAQWSPNTNISYTVHYYLDGTTTLLRPDRIVTGQTMASTVTENAATIPGYTVVGSGTESLTLAATGNVITFYYTANEDIVYTVYYYRVGTTTSLAPSVIRTNQTMAATVEEDAEDIAGYTVDMVKKSLILAATGNIIIFYYTPDNDIEYDVHYYLAGTTTPLAPSVTRTGQTMAATVYETAVTVAGYTPDVIPPLTKSLTLAATGNVITFYYTPDEDIEYIVHYYLEGTTDKVAESKPVTGQTMGATITENAILIDGYTALAPTSLTKVLKAE
ncbi:MAG: InlB B-repeat-containing protein, partial [Clostridiales bacterium]|nr:InlB B-repeat-containing protein [Clostridiales bacterium]